MTPHDQALAPAHDLARLVAIAAAQPRRYEERRRLMLDDVERELARLPVLDRGSAARTVQAMDTVPRERFVPNAMRSLAYLPMPGDIGCGQTISHPLLVAVMTSSIRPELSDVVLDVGTGSGYQAAVLSHLVARVVSVEIVPELARRARRRLRSLGCPNVEVVQGDAADVTGGPFDAIVVAAGCDAVPPPLLALLGPSGRLVMPIGPTRGDEQLMLIDRAAPRLGPIALGAVRFVPLTGRHGRSGAK